jgi:hypothetical protein
MLREFLEQLGNSLLNSVPRFGGMVFNGMRLGEGGDFHHIC